VELARTGLGGAALGLLLVDCVRDGPEYDCPRLGPLGVSRVAGVTEVAVDMAYIPFRQGRGG
jgi:hypothetical protein